MVPNIHINTLHTVKISTNTVHTSPKEGDNVQWYQRHSKYQQNATPFEILSTHLPIVNVLRIFKPFFKPSQNFQVKIQDFSKKFDFSNF